MTERQLQQAVIECAHYLGWRVAHFRPARVTRGGREVYETPVAADGKGFPDLILTHPRLGLLARELKTDTGKLSLHQQAWLDDLSAAGVDAAVWRERDWTSGRIEGELRREQRRTAA